VSFGQVVNINPDPNGDPWIVGDAITSPDNTSPLMQLSAKSANTILPNAVDNASRKYMPPVFHQRATGSCVQVAELWYTFSYEINRLRDLSTDTSINQYHPFFSYNFLNRGIATSYTLYKSGFKIIKNNGCPTFNVYYDSILDSNNDSLKFLYWMNDREKYQDGMKNRVTEIHDITWDETYESLDTLKHWIADHNEGDTSGGLAIISVLANGWSVYGVFPPGTPEELKHFVVSWGSSGGYN